MAVVLLQFDCEDCTQDTRPKCFCLWLGGYLKKKKTFSNSFMVFMFQIISFDLKVLFIVWKMCEKSIKFEVFSGLFQWLNLLHLIFYNFFF